MKKILFFVIVGCLFFAGHGFCEESKMNGWGKVKWGMTEAEVKKAEPNVESVENKGKEDKGYYFPLILKNVKIADKDFDAKFRFGENSKKLEAVALNLSGNADSSFFDLISDMLISKYGKPAKVENNKLVNSRNRIWITEKTKISLVSFGEKTISVLYESLSSNNL